MKKIMFNEIWKSITLNECNLDVSNYGNVRFSKNHKKKSFHLNKYGYPTIRIQKDRKIYTYRIHRLVAQLFIENPYPEKFDCINHKDENRQNNFVENLEWCDRNYNNNYGSHNEKIAKSKSKPIIQYDLNGNIVREWESASVAARTLGCAQSGINWCCLRKPKHNTCIGFIWRFADDKDTRYKNGKSIIKYDCNANFIEEYINITSAAKENKICITSITNCAKGRSKTAGGFKWEYKHV